MSYTIFITLIFIQAIFNGILDNIDHNKGAKALRDVWHLVKLFDRASLISIGIAAAFVDWNIIWTSIGVIPSLLLAKVVWKKFYYSKVTFWKNLDENWKFTTGIPALDRLCGFDK